METELRRTPAELRDAFPALQTPQDVAALLEVDYKTLNYHIYRMASTKKYRKFYIAKKSGGRREILAPISSIKILQRKLNQILHEVYSPRPCVHGFIKHRSIVTNAGEHRRKRYVLNVDIKDFFPSINFGRVRGMFMGKPYCVDARPATVLAQLCCHENALPQGAPTSPIVANMVCAKLDGELQRLSQANRCVYTRYADDLTFSTDMRPFPSGLAVTRNTPNSVLVEVGNTLRQVIENNGFQVNTKKVRLVSRDKRQEVTGLTANLYPNVKRKYIKQIRAMLHAWKKYGLDAATEEFRKRYYNHQRGPGRDKVTFRNVVLGKIAFLRMVRGEGDSIVQRFLNQVAQLDPDLATASAQIAIPRDCRWLFDALWVLESDSACNQGTAFALKDFGLVTCAHVLRHDTVAYRPAEPDQKYPVKVVRCDRKMDVAVLAINGHVPAELEAENISSAQLGDSLLLAGFPNFGGRDTGHMAPGYVAGIRDMLGVSRLVITPAISPGNSGGPVLNKQNRVVGIAATGRGAVGDVDKNTAISIEVLRCLRESSATGNP